MQRKYAILQLHPDLFWEIDDWIAMKSPSFCMYGCLLHSVHVVDHAAACPGWPPAISLPSPGRCTQHYSRVANWHPRFSLIWHSGKVAESLKSMRHSVENFGFSLILRWMNLPYFIGQFLHFYTHRAGKAIDFNMNF